MATKRQRAGVWHYVIKRGGLLPKPIYLSFPDESEGDEYVRRLEALLDRGIVPDEFFAKTAVGKTLRDGMRRYLGAQSHTSSDSSDSAARQLAGMMEAKAKEVVSRAIQPGGILWQQRVGQSA